MKWTWTSCAESAFSRLAETRSRSQGRMRSRRWWRWAAIQDVRFCTPQQCFQKQMMEDDYGPDEAIWLIMICEIRSCSSTPSPQQTCKGQWGQLLLSKMLWLAKKRLRQGTEISSENQKNEKPSRIAPNNTKPVNSLCMLLLELNTNTKIPVKKSRGENARGKEVKSATIC